MNAINFNILKKLNSKNSKHFIVRNVYTKIKIEPLLEFPEDSNNSSNVNTSINTSVNTSVNINVNEPSQSNNITEESESLRQTKETIEEMSAVRREQHRNILDQLDFSRDRVREKSSDTKSDNTKTSTSSVLDEFEDKPVHYVSEVKNIRSVMPSSIASSSSGSKNKDVDETSDVDELDLHTEIISNLTKQDHALVQKVDNIVRLGTELLDKNLKTNHITLERTKEQKSRWDAIKNTYQKFIDKYDTVLPRWALYTGGALSVGFFAYYVLRYRQLPLWGLIQGIVGNIGSSVATPVSHVNVSVNMPSGISPIAVPHPTTIIEHFPLASGIGMGLIAGLLVVLKFVKK